MKKRIIIGSAVILLLSLMIPVILMVSIIGSLAGQQDETEAYYDEVGAVYFDLTGTLNGDDFNFSLKDGDTYILKDVSGTLVNGSTAVSVKGSSEGSTYLTDNGKKIWQNLIAHGYSNQAAAAIMTCWWHESRFNPAAENKSEAESVRGIGLAQWSGSRHTALRDFAAGRGESWKDFGTQMEYFYYEAKSSYRRIAPNSEFAKKLTGEAAVKEFFTVYESGGSMSGVWGRYYDARLATFKPILKTYQSFGGTAILKVTYKSGKFRVTGSCGGVPLSAEADVFGNKLVGSGILGYEETAAGRVAGMRTTAPVKGSAVYNKYYKNKFPSMPNCTCYAYGRFNEILGNPNSGLTVRGNACQWWSEAQGGPFKCGTVAKPGAIVCMSGGSSGYGHVAVVERVNPDGTCLLSESRYGTSGSPLWFGTSTLGFNKNTKKYSWNGYNIQGFIYQPEKKTTTKKTTGETQ